LATRCTQYLGRIFSRSIGDAKVRDRREDVLRAEPEEREEDHDQRKHDQRGRMQRSAHDEDRNGDRRWKQEQRP